MKNTKNALITSILSFVLCCTMMLGTTFAWFTDTVSTGSNRIQSGTLKIDMEHLVDGKWVSIKENPEHEIISSDILWEPGYTAIATLRIVNEGSLALKYRLNLSVGAVSDIALAEVIDVYVLVGDLEEGRPDLSDESVWQKAGALIDLIGVPEGTSTGVLLPKEEKPVHDGEIVESTTTTFVLHMREDAGNEYQGLNLGAIYMDLYATQYTYESDSFDNQYDADAKFPADEVYDVETLIKIIRNNPDANYSSDDYTITSFIFGAYDDYADKVKGIAGVPASKLGSVKIYRADEGATVYMLSKNEIVLPENLYGLFFDMRALKTVTIENVDSGNVKNFGCLFYRCDKLVDIIGEETLDTSSATSLYYTFGNCKMLQSLDIANWDTSNVTNLESTFRYCHAMKELDLSGWDTSKVTTLYQTFSNMYSMKELDLSNFDTSKVTTMGWCFYEFGSGSSSVKIYAGDKWSVASITNLDEGAASYKPFNKLVGGEGTTCEYIMSIDSKCVAENGKRANITSRYMVVDGGESNPGLLTYKAN